jgi:signal transduction histidine kinase
MYSNQAMQLSDGVLIHAGSHPENVMSVADNRADKRALIGTAQQEFPGVLEHNPGSDLTLAETQRAMINILEDLESEKSRLRDTEKAIQNILDDVAEERALLASMQHAVLNILEDFDVEKRNVERANAELRSEVSVRAQAVQALAQANAATKASNKELEAFSYSVAHDLRAPLRSIDGFSQALVEECADSLPAEGKTYLRHVRESAQHMARLIDDLLSLSRTSRAEIHCAPVDLAVIARTVFARLRRDYPERSVEVTIPAEVAAVGDSRLLEIVFENLLGNAWKFTSKRDHAHIEVGQITQNGQLACFVRDDGAGFDMAYADKLFGVFQRLHAVREFEGTGIGLANVERIIHRHGGRVWAEGEVGRGATFYFTLKEDQ